MGKCSKEKTTEKYSEFELQEALAAVKAGRSVNSVSKEYNVPRTTLSYKKKGILEPKISRRGPECILGTEEEAQLVRWIFFVSDRGFPVTKLQLLNSVQKLLNKMERTTRLKDNRPGRRWFEGFSKRHPELSLRLSQNLLYSRAVVTEKHLRKWFNEVGLYLESINLRIIDPKRVYNCDESAFYLSPKGDRVLVSQKDKRAYSFVANDEKECVTTLFCGNAAGDLLPPMVMHKNAKMSIISALMPKGWIVGKSDSGWETAETFYEWVANVFYPWLVENNIEFPVILYVDGHVSHMTLELSDFCRAKQIILIALYPNATHILQPMDVAFFAPLKRAWREEVRDWRMENDGDRLKKHYFAGVLKKAVEKLNVQAILKSGFRATGLLPFSADAVNYGKHFKISENHAAPPVPKDTHKMSHLQFFEHMLNENLLQSFQIVPETEKWAGPIEQQALFDFWRDVKNVKSSNSSNVDEKELNNGQMKNEESPMSVAEDFSVERKEESTVHDQSFMSLDVSSDITNERKPIFNSSTTHFPNLEAEFDLNAAETDFGDDIMTFSVTEDGELIFEEPKRVDIGLRSYSDEKMTESPNHSLDGRDSKKVFERESKETENGSTELGRNSDPCQVHNKDKMVTNTMAQATLTSDDNEFGKDLKCEGLSAKTFLSQSNDEKVLDGTQSILIQKSSQTDECPLPNVPSPFKQILFWPSEKKKPRKTRASTKLKLPSVISCDIWNNFERQKAEKKRRETEEKRMKREERLKKQEMKTQQLENSKEVRRIKREQREKVLKEKEMRKAEKARIKMEIEKENSLEEKVKKVLPKISKEIKQEGINEL